MANVKKPRTRTVTETECRFVDVTVKENDEQDIRCGGPRTLGFEFYVSRAEDTKALEKFLRAELEKNKLPCMGIRFGRPEFRAVSHLWTRSRMANCIKKDADGMRW